MSLKAIFLCKAGVFVRVLPSFPPSFPFFMEVLFHVGLVETTAIGLSFVGEMSCGFQ